MADAGFWDGASGQVVKTVEGLPAASPHPDVLWSSDAKAVGLAGDVHWRDSLRYWVTSTGQPLSKQPPAGYTPMHSPDGKLRIDVVPDKATGYVTKVIDVSSGKQLHVLQTAGPQWTLGITWSRDSKRLGFTSDGAQIWDIESGQRLHTLKIANEIAWAAAFSPDGKLFASGSDNTVRLWDADSGEMLDTFRGHTGNVIGLLWSADGRTLTSSADDGMRDWDVATGKRVRHRKWQMGWPAPDGRLGADVHVNTIRVWDLETGQRRLTIMPLPDDRYLAFSSDGHYRGSRAVERELVYVVQLEDGRQETLTPAEFAKRFKWKNDPDKVGLAAK